MRNKLLKQGIEVKIYCVVAEFNEILFEVSVFDEYFANDSALSTPICAQRLINLLYCIQ